MQLCYLHNVSKWSSLMRVYRKTKFTYEIEDSGEIAFLDVLLVRKGNDIERILYRKPTDNGMYLHWNSFTLESWKRRTLKTVLLEDTM